MGQLFDLSEFHLDFFVGLVELVFGHFQVNLKLLDLATTLFEQLLFLFLLQLYRVQFLLKFTLLLDELNHATPLRL